MKQKTYFIEMEKCVSGKYYTDEESQNIPTFDKIKSAYKWVYKYNKQKKSLKNDYIFHIISEEKNVDQDPILKEEAKGKDNLEKIEESIKAIVKEKIGLWKYPRSIEFVNTLPKTATGKIQRFKLRK